MKYVLAIISVSFLFVSCRKDSTTIHPEIRSVVEAVYATGYIAPNDEYKVYAQQDGIITAVHKNEGDTITKGDVLCDLDNDVQNAKLAASEQSYDLALLSGFTHFTRTAQCHEQCTHKND
jgi:multidrug efflux pump subunit AcrA (membrane-fusion protein)